MAASTDTTTSWDISTDEGFRGWVAAVRAAIEGAGLVRTADTGQIDTETVTFPTSEMSGTSASQSRGFDIFRFDDAEQATNPVFVKVYYGRGDSAGQAKLAVQAGKGTNGAGVLSEATMIANGTSGGISDTPNRVIHAAFDDGAFVLAAIADSTHALTTHGMAYIVERTRDADGDFDGRLVYYGFNGSTTSSTRGVQIWDGAWSDAFALISLAGKDVTPEGETPIGLVYFSGVSHPLISCAIVPNAAVGDQGSLAIEGVSRDYRSVLHAPPTYLVPAVHSTSSSSGFTDDELFFVALDQ